MRTTQIVLLAAVILLAAAGSMASPGEIMTQSPSPGANCLGMASDGRSFWIVDRLLDRIYKVNPADGSKIDSIPSPGHDPLGLAWDGTRLWCADGNEKTIYSLNPRTGKSDKRLETSAIRPSGLAWDGDGLWVADEARRKLHFVDTETGLIARSLPAPSRNTTGLAFDGKYLWVADRQTDRIYMVDRSQGDVIITLQSPGPYPWGLAWDDGSLWNIDYQKDRLYRLTLDDPTTFSREESKTEQVEIVHQVRNLGPEKISRLTVAFALPENRDSQELLDSASFALPPSRTATDRWGQRVAFWDLENLPPGSSTDLRMTVPARIFATRYFVHPDRAGTFSQIPRDIKAQYLGDERLFGRDNPAIRDALKSAIGDENRPYWIARKIYNYVIDHVTYILEGGWSSGPEVLRRGTGSCSEYAFLYVAMCRAAGIPARLTGSVVIRDDDASYDNIFHRWAEIYLPNYGWIPVDPSGGDSPLPADRADNFGYLGPRYLITTVGGGNSDLLGWSYNSAEQWQATGEPNVVVETFAEWSPLSEEVLASKAKPALTPAVITLPIKTR